VIVAITGGTGFIGRHLVARYVERGDEVRYLTRKEQLNGIPGATAFSGSLSSPAAELRKFAGGADVLYHCAAELHNKVEMHNTNVLGTANLLDAADGEIGRWVQLSSTGVYGNPLHGEVDEDFACNPTNPYEASKVASDALVFASAKKGLPCVVMRPSNVYAVDMPNQSLFGLLEKIDQGMFFYIGRPGAVANYIHVENVVDALVLCGTSRLPANGRVYIVSDHRKLEEFVGIIAAALGRQPTRRRLPEFPVRVLVAIAENIPGFPLSSSRVDALTSRTVYRTDRIAAELGYRNRISMEDGIGELVRHWRG
jgi:nucleoside-diphosphate-sugar epimerase